MGQTGVTNMSSPSSWEDMLEDSLIAESLISAIVSARQFNVIYDTTYQYQDEEKLVRLMKRCERITHFIANATSPASLESALHLADAALVPILPIDEVRILIKTVVQKDVRLIRHMPEVRKMLGRVLRAIETSRLFNPTDLRRITADIEHQKRAGGSAGG